MAGVEACMMLRDDGERGRREEGLGRGLPRLVW